MTERSQAIRVRNVTAVAHVDDRDLRRFAERLSSRGYGIHETPHFVVCRRPPNGSSAVLLHTFDSASVDEDLSEMITDELGPLGVVHSLSEYGDALFAVVASTWPSPVDCPHCGRSHLDLTSVWRHYCINTLRRLRPLMAKGPGPNCTETHVVQFAAIYRRIIDCCAGTSVLDVGTSLGFLPILLAEHVSDIAAVGCDNRRDAVVCATDLAEATQAGRVTFRLGDVLAPDFAEIGRYDTVTAVHLLEHLPEDSLHAALTNMLSVTGRRLIIAVPYERVAEPLYGHMQTFTSEKLEAWGRWCVETQGGGRFWCEDVYGGLLIVDRPA
jgi:SAM-dependent methyltransferase